MMVLTWALKGFRFRPTDQELIENYLNVKNLGDETLVHEAINEINICRFDPWDLRGQSKIQSEDDQVWYFFSPRDTKYSNSKRANRQTESGYWKATGRDRSIKGKNQKVIGIKKTLVFYRGRVPKGIKTSWVMHEYHSSTLPPEKGVYVLCKVKDKSNSEIPVPSGGGAEPTHPLLCSSETNVQAYHCDFAEPTHPLPCSSEVHVTTEETSETIVQAEETPSSVCDFGEFDTDLNLQWDELDGESSLLVATLLSDFSSIDDPVLSESHSLLVDLENIEELWGSADDDLSSSREHWLKIFMQESSDVAKSFNSLYQSNLINTSEGEISSNPK